LTGRAQVLEERAVQLEAAAAAVTAQEAAVAEREAALQQQGEQVAATAHLTHKEAEVWAPTLSWLFDSGLSVVVRLALVHAALVCIA